MAAIKEINLQTPTGKTHNPVEEAVVDNIKLLFETTKLVGTEYVIPNGDEDLAVDIVTTAHDDELIFLSTLGSGASLTKGSITIDGVKLPYRSEFFSVAAGRETSVILGEVLAKLAFIVNQKKEMFTPGMVVGGIAPAGSKLTHAFLTVAPVGFSDKEASPIVIEGEFAILWVAVTLVTQDEADLINSGPEGFEAFKSFIEGLEDDAFSLTREVYSA